MISTRIVRHLQSRFWSSKKLGSPKDVLELNSKPVKIAGNESLAMFNDKLTLKINAVSLNSIDHWLINGRAANVRESYQKLTNLCVDQNFENSQIAGRDFHATVVSDNGLKFLEGSKVIGVCHPFDNGALSEYLTISEEKLYPAIEGLTPEQNAALPFATCTILSSLGIDGGLSVFGKIPIQKLSDFQRKRCLVIGATGGVGSLLTQILIQQNAGVVDGIAGSKKALEQLGVRKAISYHDENYQTELTQNDYDFVFDCADGEGYQWVGEYMNNIESYLISYSSPLLQILGSASLLSFPEFYSGYSRTDQLLKRAAGEGANFRYGFFSERKSYFEEMGKFNFKPKISKIYSFEDAPLALESMVSENHFGKVVVTMTS